MNERWLHVGISLTTPLNRIVSLASKKNRNGWSAVTSTCCGCMQRKQGAYVAAAAWVPSSSV